MVGIARADRLAEIVPDGPGPGHQHCAGADLFRDPALQKLHTLELWQPVERSVGKGHGDIRADCAVVLTAAAQVDKRSGGIRRLVRE